MKIIVKPEELPVEEPKYWFGRECRFTGLYKLQGSKDIYMFVNGEIKITIQTGLLSVPTNFHLNECKWCLSEEAITVTLTN